ncbi:ABC transporter ATP-binding protein [Thermococcus waiotapuensis]|uniref:ABC transporter ATP-binding protein n=1 Tax=Thermococcus waiotapuensis TaxID=90909 RepID=A0AAE4NW96_9EURY|nr:ABC transporter ATP-binding protein [Thermococcus waiotapuensis]MDV3103998.1 ABC transporter ATP-binding protein [Thermococcus waiotapuensis]
MRQLLESSGLSKTYGRGENSVKALDSVSFRLSEGISYILGPNGSGKSTLIKIIAKLLRPDSGKVRIHGKPLEEYPLRNVGFAFEKPVLHSRLKVQEYLKDVADYRGFDNTEELIETFRLSSVRDRRFGELSLGYKRRFLVAVAFAGYPGVVFLDEPFSNVDIVAKAEIMEGIISINRERNVSTVIVSHVFDSLSKIDSMVVLYSGKVVANPIGQEVKLLKKVRFVFNEGAVEDIGEALNRIRAGEDPIEVECSGIEESIMEILKGGQKQN